MAELAAAAGRPGRYAREARKLLSHLDMEVGGEPEPTEEDEEQDQEGEQDENEPNDGQSRGGEDSTSQTESMTQPDTREVDQDEGREGADQMDGEMAEGSGSEEPGRPASPGGPSATAGTTSTRTPTRSSPPSSTRWSRPRSCATRRS